MSVNHPKSEIKPTGPSNETTMEAFRTIASFDSIFFHGPPDERVQKQAWNLGLTIECYSIEAQA